MPQLTDQQLADALLTIAAAVPSDVPWNVVAVHGFGVVLAWDVREEADPAILEARASEQGELVATSMDHHDVAPSPRIGDPLDEITNGFAEDYVSDGYIPAGPYFGVDDPGHSIGRP